MSDSRLSEIAHLFDSAPPHSAEAEAAVLGAIIQDCRAFAAVAKVIDGPADFHVVKHAALYDVLARVARFNERFDIVPIKAALDERGLLADVGGVEYLLRLAESCPDASNAAHYARIVREHAATRSIIDAAGSVLREAHAGGNGTMLSAIARFQLAVDLAKPQDEAPKFIFHTAAEFDAMDLRVTYHVPGVLVGGAVPTMIAGTGKSLKTSIAVDLLVSIATGTPFLGHDVAAPCPVALMSGETGGSTLQNLLRRVCASKSVTPPSNFHVCTAVPSLRCEDDLDAIEKVIVATGAKVFAIDPAYLALRGLEEAGNLFAVSSFLLPITAMAVRTGCTPVIVHHTSKGATRANVNEPAELENMAFAGFQEWAGQWLLLSRRRRYDPDMPGDHELWLTVGGRDGHSGLFALDIREGAYPDRHWTVAVNSAAEAREASTEAAEQAREAVKRDKAARQIQVDAEAIYGALSYGPDTAKGLREGRSGVPRTDRSAAAIARLLRDGKIEPCKIDKAGRSYDGFQRTQ